MNEVQGLTLRDWMAGQALMGMLAKADVHTPVSATTLSSSTATLHPTDDQLAERAYRLADAMLRAGGHQPAQS